MITATQLESAGYQKYPAPFKHYALRLYQKRFDDSEGKKYFIQFYEYAEVYGVKAGYSSDAQFKDRHGNTFNVECLTNDSIESVEAFFERVWVSCSCVHYEEWG